MRNGLFSFYEDLSTDEEEVEKCNRYNTRSAMRKKYVPQQNPSSIEELKENHRRENYTNHPETYKPSQ
jgi:peroxiredoxin family protein